MKDGKCRGIEYLRISVTDRCNFRCQYCMPAEGIESLPHSDILTFEEIIKVCRSMVKLGISKIKLTGGEPLVRKNFIELVREIKSIEGIEEITLTTNGFLLEEQLDELIEAGITHVNISLDTLKPERFKEIARVDGLDKVLSAIHKAANSSLKNVKINTLIANGLNEDEIVSLAALAKEYPLNVRFIELMPIGLGKDLKGINKEEIIRILESAYGKLIPYHKRLGNGPAKYYEIEGFKGKVGFISAVSECFCEDCNRVRLTANGYLKLCLHSTKGLDLRSLLRNEISQEALTETIRETIENKPDRHHFNDLEGDHLEEKIMAQIGG